MQIWILDESRGVDRSTLYSCNIRNLSWGWQQVHAKPQVKKDASLTLCVYKSKLQEDTQRAYIVAIAESEINEHIKGVTRGPEETDTYRSSWLTI